MSKEPCKILIADDEKPARRRLVSLLQVTSAEAVIVEAVNGRDTIELIRSFQPDLVFLDMQMPVYSGLKVIDEIGASQMPFTVFVTAYDAHAIDAFQANALDYLLKPYSDERFNAALQRAKSRLQEAHLSRLGEQLLQLSKLSLSKPRYLERLAVKGNRETHLIHTDLIESIEGAGSYVSLHTKGGEHLYRGTLNHLSTELDPSRFVRVHRSAIVNIAAIQVLTPTTHGDFEAKLRSGRRVQISRTYRGELETRLRQVF